MSDIYEENNSDDDLESKPSKSSKEILNNFLTGDNKDNIAEDLDSDTCQKIGLRILEGFQQDLNSSEEWLRDVKKVEELAILTSKKKTRPLPNSANVKFPIISKAVYEFSSRVFPEIFKDDKVVKSGIIGKDYTGEKRKKADKVADYMNYQLCYESDTWSLEMDRLLTRLALIGFVCKKSYYDPICEEIKSDLCEPNDLIINSDVKSIQDARRITHILHVKPNDLIEGARAGVYCKETVDKVVEQFENEEIEPNVDILEQHTFLDLDNDDYLEPYIVTVLRDTGKVLRIIPRYTKKDIKFKKDQVVRIKPVQLFTDYHFLVSPKGKFQSVGFGILLLHVNEAINTILNQLLDAGQIANMQSGYIDSRLKEIGSSEQGLDRGEYKKIKSSAGLNLKDGILPIINKEPSQVLYQLLGLLIGAAKDLSSSNDLLSGNSSTENTKTGATQALIAEGVKVHNSINKRVYRSLGEEFYKIFILNGTYLDPEKATKILDEPITVDDFDADSVDIIPVADPNLASGAKLSADVQILQAIMGLPGVDPAKVAKRIIDKVIIDHPEEIMMDPNAQQQPNPEVIKIQADIQNMSEQNKLKAHELDLEEKRIQMEMYKVECQCLELKAKAILEMAQAQATNHGVQFDQYVKELDVLSQKMQNEQDQTQMMHDYTSQQSAQQHNIQMQQAQQAHDQQMQQQQQQQVPPTDGGQPS